MKYDGVYQTAHNVLLHCSTPVLLARCMQIQPPPIPSNNEIDLLFTTTNK